MKLKTLDDFDFKDKLVLLRIDINSPIVSGKVEDNPRFYAASETIKALLEKKAKLVILAHQGRRGDKDFLETLEQHAEILSNHVGKKIRYLDDLFGEGIFTALNSLDSGEAILLKNVRCFDDESLPENSRYPALCNLFNIYVNDAFSVSHRKQGSIVVPPKILPSCIGLSFQKEINALSRFKIKKDQKAVYLIGGQKIEDYLPLFNVLNNKNNKILASGVLANLLLISQGKLLGYENKWMKQNRYDKLLPKLKEIYSKYKEQIVLPIDFAVGDVDINKAKRREISLSEFPTNDKIWDTGKKTVELFKEEIKDAKIIFMKGPLGYSEIKDFAYSTVEILREISRLTKQNNTFSLLGGGHLTTTAEKNGIKRFGYVSNSGGALIAFISGEKLPGIEALEKGIEK